MMFPVVCVRALQVVDAFDNPARSLDDLRWEVERLCASIAKAQTSGSARDPQTGER